MNREPRPPFDRAAGSAHNPGELRPGADVQGSGDRPGGSGAGGPADAAGASGPHAALDFDRIIELYGRRLYSLAYRLAGSRQDAEDLSQEAMVRGYRSLQSFRGEADFYTFLYQILLNLWRNQLRSRRRWRMIPLWGSRDPEKRDTAPADELADPSAGPHDRLVGRQQARRLHQALALLDPRLRAVLVLRVSEELEYDEIARTLGIPIGTVRSRLARARSRIRRLLTE